MNKEKYRQEMLSQIIIKSRKEAFNEREELYNKKYLGQIIEDEKPEFKNNNLILSPVGSGKSHLIENNLIPKNYNKDVIYLTSNTALKDSLCPDDNEIRKILAQNGESLGFFTSGNKSKFGDVSYKVHVMTYAEFGERIHHPNEKLTNNVGLVFCDEIHSLPRYFEYDNSYKLGMALNWLLRKHDNIQIFYFTATQASIKDLEKRKPGYFDSIKVFNYLNHPDIRKYVANSVYYINHIEQLRIHFKAKLESFNYYGRKALVFTKLISEQEKIKELVTEEGFKPIVLWSINNKENKMSDEQLRARESMLNTGLIPEPYNVLIINGAMQEGWNLYDDKITMAVLDTVDITEQIQALGRIRQDVDLVIKKTSDKNLVKFDIDVPTYYLNKELTPEVKNLLCEELHILDDKRRVRKWPTIKVYIKESGYHVEDKTIIIDGKRVRISIITVPGVKSN